MGITRSQLRLLEHASLHADESVRGTALRAEGDASGQIRLEIGEAERNQPRSNPAQSARICEFAVSEKLMGFGPFNPSLISDAAKNIHRAEGAARRIGTLEKGDTYFSEPNWKSGFKPLIGCACTFTSGA